MQRIYNLKYLFSLLLFTSLLAGAGTQDAAAQGDESASHLGVVDTYNLPVFQTPLIEEYGKDVVAVAEAADLGMEFAWFTYTSDFDYIVYAPIASMAELADDERMMRAVAGTPGEELMKELSIEGISGDYRTEVVEMIPEWSYLPAGAEDVTRFIEIQEHWVVPASRNNGAYEAVLKDLLEFFEEIDYPFAIQAYRIRIGESRYAFVFNFNDRGEYQNEYSPEALMQEYPEFGAIALRLLPHLEDFETRVWSLRPDLSYLPE